MKAKLISMEKIIRITGLLSMVFCCLTLLIWTMGVLWNTPNEGIVHNLFRVSTMLFVTLGSVWFILFTYRESK